MPAKNPRWVHVFLLFCSIIAVVLATFFIRQKEQAELGPIVIKELTSPSTAPAVAIVTMDDIGACDKGDLIEMKNGSVFLVQKVVATRAGTEITFKDSPFSLSAHWWDITKSDLAKISSISKKGDDDYPQLAARFISGGPQN